MSETTHTLAPALMTDGPIDQPFYSSDHTSTAADMAILHGLATVNEVGQTVFSNREVITRDTFPIEGKVDIRSWVAGAEAIVVDSSKEQEGYNKLRGAYAKAHQYKPNDERSVLSSVYEAVSNTMDYDLARADTIAEYVISGGTESRKVNLEWYLDEGKGVCRHMALAASWLGGELYQQGLLDGTLTAEVNQRDQGVDRSAHEWARYTSPDGEVYIIDPAQKFFGTLRESVEKAQWEYFRPGEKEQYLVEQAAAVALQHTAEPVPDGHPEQSALDPLTDRYNSFDTECTEYFRILRDEKSLASLKPEYKASLLRGSQTFLELGSGLVMDGLKKQGIFGAQQVAEMADSMAEELGVERNYPKNMIPDVNVAEQWFGKVIAAASETCNPDNPNANFDFVKKYGPLIKHEAWRLIVKPMSQLKYSVGS